MQNNVKMAILHVRKLTFKRLSKFFNLSDWELAEPRSVWLENWILNFPKVDFASIWLSIQAPYPDQCILYSIF